MSPAEESQLARSIALLGEYGMAFSKQDLCAFVKYHLEANSRVIPQFKDNMPGYEWLKSFLQRQKEFISPRLCQNICAKRARVSREIVANFFRNIEPMIREASPNNIINYDETHIADSPKGTIQLFRRGSKKIR